jgi:predicted HicB family RNase H-like nuclease
MGRPRVYSEPRVTTAVRLSAAMREDLARAAREEGVSVNQLVVRTLMEYLRRLRAGPTAGTP